LTGIIVMLLTGRGLPMIYWF